MLVSVLITCHNRVATTLSCCKALRKSVLCASNESDGLWFGDLRVVVFLVDDGSNDGTGEVVRCWFDSVADQKFSGHVIDADGSLYWSKGMALAWRTAIKYEAKRSEKFDFFLWLNDDVIFEPDGFFSLLNDYKIVNNSSQEVVCGACGIVRNDIWSMTYGALDASYEKIVPNGAPIRTEGWFTGNVLLVPRKTYEIIGMISDEYTHAYGDNDYAMRLKRSGIPFFASSKYVGICEYGAVNKIKEWPLNKRLPLLIEPSMWNLRDIWVFQMKFYNIFRAILHSVHKIYVVFKG